MKKTIVQDKSYAFSIQIVNTYKKLVAQTKEYTLSKQLLRSGTSIGANIEESQGSYSRKEFTSKMKIAYKECLETIYWLRLLSDTNYLEKNVSDQLLANCVELKKLLSSILITLQKTNSI